MRRRFVRETKKEVKQQQPNEKQVEKKENLNDNKKKEIKNYVKSAILKGLDKEDISTNKLSGYNFMEKTADSYETVPVQDFLTWLFSNVLTYEDLKINDKTYKFINPDATVENFNIVNEYDLKGVLVAGSCVYYDCGTFAIGMIIDKVLDNKKQVLSSINISYNGTILPSEDISNELVTWIITSNNAIIPTIKGTKVQDVKQFLDGSKADYDAHYPVNVLLSNKKPLELSSIIPDRTMQQILPSKQTIPQEKMVEGNNYNVCVSVTGYLFIYNKSKTGTLDNSSNVTINYIRVPVDIVGSPDLIQIAKLINWDFDGEVENINILGECINVIQVPLKSEFFQNNFGDTTTGSKHEGHSYVCYPRVWWEVNDLQF